MSLWWFFSLIAAILLDLLFGDPYCLPHPVRWIGTLIASVEKILRKMMPKQEKWEFLGGIVLVLVVTLVSTICPFLLLWIVKKWNFQWYVFLEIIMSYQLLAMKSLKTESSKVYDQLKADDLEKARKAVSMIVGRDTQNLTKIGVTKAAVETVAENTSDGVIAPLFYLILGGPVLGFFYKSINTMDSMVGYKNETYLFFGRFAAKLDDVVNYIPARISGMLFVAASFFLRLDGKNAWRIYRRDSRNHASPNAAQTEAACAGGLQVQLAGNAWYFGKLYEKPYIGDALRPIEIEDIPRVNRLMYGASFFGFFVFSALKFFVIWLWMGR